MNVRSPLVVLHLAVLLLGMTGLFAKFLSIGPQGIILGRTLFTVLFIAVLAFFLQTSLRLGSFRNGAIMLASGLVLTLHWLSFFHSIQMSTVAIGVIGFATYPVFVTLLEPLIFRERYHWIDLLTSGLILAGLWCVVPDFHIGNSNAIALIWAVISGLTAAIFTLINRQLVEANHYVTINFYQHLVAALAALPIVAWTAAWPSAHEIGLLAILGIIFTALPQMALVRSLKYVKAQLASILVGLEPIYSILFAIVLLDEIPSLLTILGGAIVLSAVVIASRAHQRRGQV